MFSVHLKNCEKVKRNVKKNVFAILSSDTGCNSKDFSEIFEHMNAHVTVPLFFGC